MNTSTYATIKIYLIRMIASGLACTFWMVQGRFATLTMEHWFIGLKTALSSATILLLISLQKIIKFNGKLAKAILTTVVVAFVDYFIHPGHFGGAGFEAIITGLTATCLVFLISITILHVYE